MANTLKAQPPPGTILSAQERKLLTSLWQPEDEFILAQQLKQEVIDSVVLARPNYNRRFYLKTEWSCHGVGAVLCQVDLTCMVSLEAEKSKAADSPWIFDKTLSGPRLVPILFLSWLCNTREQNHHSYVGETGTGQWAIGKLSKYLMCREFTWITVCRGLRQFFTSDAHLDRQVEQWKGKLLQYHFQIVHRNARMLIKCNAPTQYNMAWNKCRAQVPTMTAPKPTVEEETKPMAMTSIPVRFVGPTSSNKQTTRSSMAEVWDTNRQILVINGMGFPMVEALKLSTLKSFHVTNLNADVGTPG
jgi:hypothetical protein